MTKREMTVLVFTGKTESIDLLHLDMENKAAIKLLYSVLLWEFQKLRQYFGMHFSCSSKMEFFMYNV